jgi:hypothetical protein
MIQNPLQRYNKKMTYANLYAIFLYFYPFNVFTLRLRVARQIKYAHAKSIKGNTASPMGVTSPGSSGSGSPSQPSSSSIFARLGPLEGAVWSAVVVPVTAAIGSAEPELIIAAFIVLIDRVGISELFTYCAPRRCGW